MLATRCLIATMAMALTVSLAARAETFVNRKTGEEVTGKLYGAVVKDGKYMYYVKGEDKKGRYLLQGEWDKREDSVQPKGEPGKVPAKKGGAAVDVDFGEKGPPAAKLQVMEVVATGVGADPDKAKLNAFTNAIEKAVGVLVDSETLIKNDQIVRDQVLTFSRGFVEDFKVLEQSEKDGLYQVRIRAVVARTRLVEKLTAAKVAVRDLPGGKLALETQHEVLNEKNAAEMFRKTMEDFAVERILKVEILGNPEIIEKNEVRAKFRVNFTLSPDLQEWDKFRAALAPLLSRIARAKATGTTNPQRFSDPYEMCWLTFLSPNPQLAKPGEALLHVFRSSNRSMTLNQTHWDLFAVPATLDPVLSDSASQRYQIKVAMLTGDGAVIVQDVNNPWGGNPCMIATDFRALAPLFIHRSPGNYAYYGMARKYTRELTVELDQMAKIAKCVVLIEREPTK